MMPYCWELNALDMDSTWHCIPTSLRLSKRRRYALNAALSVTSYWATPKTWELIQSDQCWLRECQSPSVRWPRFLQLRGSDIGLCVHLLGLGAYHCWFEAVVHEFIDICFGSDDHKEELKGLFEERWRRFLEFVRGKYWLTDLFHHKTD